MQQYAVKVEFEKYLINSLALPPHAPTIHLGVIS